MGSFGPTTLNIDAVEFDNYNDGAGGTGLNVIRYYSYDDDNANTIGASFHNQFHVVYVVTGAGVSTIPITANAGSGVAWGIYLYDPDHGTWNNLRSMSFTQTGTGGNTFTMAMTAGGGTGTIQRTSGSMSYTVYVSRLSGGT